MKDSEQQMVASIIATLKADPRRYIYEAQYPHDEFWISYRGGGPFAGRVIHAMISGGLLVRKYPDLECFVLAVNG